MPSPQVSVYRAIRHLLHNGHDHTADDAVDPVVDTSADASMPGMSSDSTTSASGMPMTYSTNWQNRSLIFDVWQMNSTQDYVLTVIAVFFIAMSFEWLTMCHRIVSLKFSCANASYMQMQHSRSAGKTLSDDTIVNEQIHMSHDIPFTWSQRLFCGVIHIVKAFISFILMVVFMTLDVGLSISLLFGLFGGFVLFHPNNSSGDGSSAGLFGLGNGSFGQHPLTTYQSLYNHVYRPGTTLKTWCDIRHKYFGWLNKVVRIAPRWTIGEMLMVFTFLAINIGLIVPSLIQLAHPNDCPGYADDDDDCNTWNTVMFGVDMLGLLGCGDAAVMLMPITRNSVMLFITGMPFEVAIKWHRRAGYFSMLVITLHVIAGIWYYALKNALDQVFYADPTLGFGDSVLYGLIGYICGMIAIFTSFAWVRRAWYNLFYYTHIPMFLGFLAMGCAHKPLFVTWFLIGPAALWFVDWMIRLRTKLEPTLLVSMKAMSADVTELVFLKTDLHYVAGQYVFISIDALNRLHSHPISLASSPHEPYMRCYIRANKLKPSSWSNRLHELAQRVGAGEVKPPSLYVEGPYGCIDPHRAHKPHVTLIAAGIGITNIRSLLYDMAHSSQIIEQVTLIWCVRDRNLLSILQQQSTTAMHERSQSQFTNDSALGKSSSAVMPNKTDVEEVETLLESVEDELQIEVKNTGVQLNTHIYLTDSELNSEQLSELQAQHANHKLYLGRPKLNEYMNGESDVVVCGPNSLLQHTRDVYRMLVKNGTECRYREDTFVM